MAPEIPGTRIQRLLGEGACGEVYHGVGAGGVPCAIKVLHPAHVNREYVEYCYEKVSEVFRKEGSLTGLMPVLSYQPQSASGECYYIMPFETERMQNPDGTSGRFIGRTIERWCGQLDPALAWRLVLEVALGVATLHKNAILHCNLKTSNVFLSAEDPPSALVSDWGQGWIKGVSRFPVGDHAFYASPEQLREPGSIEFGKGQKWDVYAFGVLAWRILTGDFPRGQAAIEDLRGQAPKPAEFADVIEAEPDIQWPTSATDPVELRRREIIEKCLHLDPSERWVDMREVADALGAVEHELAEAVRWRDAHAEKDRSIQDAAEEKTRLLSEHESTLSGTKKKLKTAITYGLVTTAVAAALGLSTFVFAGMRWRASSKIKQLEKQISNWDVDRQAELTKREGQTAEAREAERQAKEAARIAQANLTGAQDAANLFFSSFMETSRQLPASMAGDRTKWLQEARNYFTGFLDRAKDNPDLAEASLSAQGHLAEVTLSLSGVNDAAALYEQAQAQAKKLIAAHPQHPQVEQWRGKLTEYALASAVIRQEAGQDAKASLDVIRQTLSELEAIPAGKATAEQIRRRAEGEALLAQGVRWTDPQEALTRLYKVPDFINQISLLSATRPSDQMLQCRAYLEQGQIERDQLKLDAALATQLGLIERLIEAGDTPEARWLLALCYGEVGELLDDKGEHKDASRAHGEAVLVLTELAKTNPGRDDYRFQLAKRYGDIALILKDANDATRGLDFMRGSVDLLKTLTEKDKTSRKFLLEMARRKAELADLLMGQKLKDEALPFARDAASLMVAIDVTSAPSSGAEIKQRLSMARTLSTTGNALELAGLKVEAKAAYTKAQVIYQGLAAARPGDEVMEKGASWIKDRLNRLK